MKYNLSGAISEIIPTKTLTDKFIEIKSKVFVVDSNLYELHKELVLQLVGDNPMYLLIATEQNKTLNEAEMIFQFLMLNKVNRSSVIIGIGGGITTDITAYAASVFKRGCRLQLVPTTFLAMIDAAIGGKTGVNFQSIKNAIGTFYPAEKVYINTGFMRTLSKKELRSGWAECIKTALIGKTGLFQTIKQSYSAITEEIILETIDQKMRICEGDLQDTGFRRKLNMGHTFAHITETATNNELSHGEAVALGISAALELSRRRKMISESEYNKMHLLVEPLLIDIELLPQHKHQIASRLSEILAHDKKNSNHVNMILFDGFCSTKVVEIEDTDEVRDVLLHGVRN